MAGTGATGTPTGDGGAATSAVLGSILDVAAGRGGEVYLAGGSRIRVISADGIIETIAGTGTASNTGDGGQAKLAGIWGPQSLAVGRDGSIVFVQQDTPGYIRRISPDGIIRRVAGCYPRSATCILGQGQLASQSYVGWPVSVAVSDDGTIYYVDAEDFTWGSTTSDYAIRVITPDGHLTAYAGTKRPNRTDCFGSSGQLYCGDGGPAAAAELTTQLRVDVHPEGGVVIGGSPASGKPESALLRVEGALPGLVTTDVVSPREGGRLVDVFDQHGRHLRTRDAETGIDVVTVGYDVDGRVASVTDELGRATTVERDGEGVPLRIVGPFGHETDLTLDVAGWLSTLTNEEDEQWMLTHDAEGLLATLQRPGNGEPSELTYDADGLLIADENAEDHATTLSRTAIDGGHVVDRTTPLGRTYSYAIADATSGTEERTVEDAAGLVATRDTRPDGIITRTSPDGTSTRIELAPDPRWASFAPYPRSTVITIPGLPTKTIFRQRTVAGLNATDPYDFTSVTEKTWINPTLLSGAPTTDSPVSTRTYTRASRTELMTSPVGRQTSRILDAAGRPVTIAAPDVASTTLSYDPVTKKMSSMVQSARTTAWSYGTDGLLAAATNAIDEQTGYDWDQAERLIAETRPDLEVTAFGYDDNGSMVALTPPGQPAHAFENTPLGQLAEYEPPTVPGTGVTSYGYNADRQLDLETRPGAIQLDHQYNATNGRLEAIVGPTSGSDQEKVALTYDAAGRVATRQGPWWTSGTPAQSLAFTYAGPYVTKEDFTGAAVGDVQWTYDAQHRPATENIGGAHSITFTYDNDSLLTAAGELTIGRDLQSGKIDTVTSTFGGHTVVETRTYDPTYGELASITTTWDATVLFDVDYTRDDLGRIQSKTETIGGVTTLHEYGYDAAGRLTDVAEDAVLVEEYAYDANGNRTSTTNSAGTFVGEYDDQDRLLSYGGDDFTWTPNGELESRSGASDALDLTYDVFGNLRLATVGATDLEYIADARGRRVQRKVGGSVDHSLLWRSALAPAALLDAAGAVAQRFVYADGVNVPDLVIDVASGERWRLVKDHLGSVRMVVDVATGTVVQALEYDAWGRVLSDSNPGAQPFGFAGGLYDPDTGLVRFGARDYDPETGRWLSKDPIRFDGGDTNLYAYVGNDPVNYVDHTGLQLVQVATAGAAVATAVGIYAGLDACAKSPECHDAAAEAIDDGVSAAVDTLTGALMSIGKGVCSPYRDPPRPPPPDPCAWAALGCASACGAGSTPQPTYGQYYVCFRQCMTAAGCP